MKNIVEIFMVFILAVLVLSTSGCSSNQVTNPVTTNQNVTDDEIYAYMESIWDSYENNNSIDIAEALVFIDASEHFNKSLLEIGRAYNRVTRRISGLNISDAEQDVLSIRRFKDIGFVENNGKWAYDGKEVNMGEQLPIPESMQPKEPEKNKEINVVMEVLSVEAIGGENVRITVSTNLPDGMELMIDLKGSGGYWSQDTQTVEAGNFATTFGKVSVGNYQLTITSPTVSIQPENVKTLLGENGKNMVGDLIKFDPVWGYSLEYTSDIEIK